MKKLILIGGVHGVGKTTICKTISSDLYLHYLSASELIKWSELNEDPKNKLVVDIPNTQARLISAFNQYPEGKYLLDGHFCLFNVNSEIIRISYRTFELLAPLAICVIVGTSEEIALSQISRGGQVYKTEVITEMQNCEIDHAMQVANHLGIAFIKAQRSEISLIIAEVKKLLNCESSTRY